MNILASIQKIKEINVHPNADQLELATVQGWTVVVKKGEFKAGDLCVYIALDSIVDTAMPEFAFLESRHGRITTQKLRGVVSQGICFDRDVAFKYLEREIDNKALEAIYQLKSNRLSRAHYLLEGTDVTELLNVKKYNKPEPQCKEAAGNFPLHLVQKTDETNIQALPTIVEFMKAQGDCVATFKHDGTSATFIKEHDTLRVCSRNLEMKEGNNVYWQIAHKYHLDMLPNNIALQGEIIGPGIQGNKEGLKEIEFRAFSMKRFSSNNQYESYEELHILCNGLEIPMADLYYIGSFKWNSIKELIDEVDSLKYKNGTYAEGLVFRTMNNIVHPELMKPVSFKVKNNKFMLKHGE